MTFPLRRPGSVYNEKSGTRAQELIKIGADYIISVPNDPVLVICYKGWLRLRGLPDRHIKDAILDQLPEAHRSRVSFLTWGSHTASNVHRDISHAIVMGLNFLAGGAPYAAAGAALGRRMQSNEDQPGALDVAARMRAGQLRDSTLQAVLRGKARLGIDGDCGPMEVVILQSHQTGLREQDLRGMFPGVNLIDGSYLLPSKPLTGKALELSKIVARRLAAGETEMTNVSLYSELEMKKQGFGKLVARPVWQAWIAARGLNSQPLHGNNMGLRLVGGRGSMTKAKRLVASKPPYWPPTPPKPIALSHGGRAVMSVLLTGALGEGKSMLLDLLQWDRVAMLLGTEWTLRAPAGRSGPLYVTSARKQARSFAGSRDGSASQLSLARWLGGR